MEANYIFKERASWIFVVDGGRGRLLRGTSVPPGRIHLEERGLIESERDEYEHGRPSPRSGKNGHTYASLGHESEEQLSRFARRVVEWLDQTTKQHEIDRLALFAPPRFLGALRQAFPASLAGRIREHEGDLANISAGDLARHRAVVKVLADNGRT